jgi:hypothetical protein
MRILISKNSKKEVLIFLKEKYSAKSLRELSQKLRVTKSNLDEWFYNEERYLPEEIIPKQILSKLKILDKKKEGWGRIEGGKKTYSIILKKYGEEEMQRRRSRGGKASYKKRKFVNPNFFPDEKRKDFLEFYGALIGDGWLSRLKYKNKITYLIGFSGHKKLDRNYFLYLKKIIKNNFNRNPYLKDIKNVNASELLFSHKELQEYLIKNLKFPLGKKINLKINNKFKNFEDIRWIIRGIFDTDGSFYLDKTPSDKPYPCISIEMKAPLLLKQIRDILIERGFRISFRNMERDGKEKTRITLKGKKQLNKWMKEIGSSNKKHLDKILPLWRNLDSATAS